MTLADVCPEWCLLKPSHKGDHQRHRGVTLIGGSPTRCPDEDCRAPIRADGTANHAVGCRSVDLGR